MDAFKDFAHKSRLMTAGRKLKILIALSSQRKLFIAIIIAVPCQIHVSITQT